MKMVSVRAEDLPPLTEDDFRRMAELASMPDEDIDLSDIPETTPEQWHFARRPGQPDRRGAVKLEPDVRTWCSALAGEADIDVIVNGALRLLLRREAAIGRPEPTRDDVQRLVRFAQAPTLDPELNDATELAVRARLRSHAVGRRNQRSVSKLEQDVFDWARDRLGGRDLDVVVNEALRAVMLREASMADTRTEAA